MFVLRSFALKQTLNTQDKQAKRQERLIEYYYGCCYYYSVYIHEVVVVVVGFFIVFDIAFAMTQSSGFVHQQEEQKHYTNEIQVLFECLSYKS